MKTHLTYGIGITIGTSLVTLVLFFTGLHNDPAKLSIAGWVGGLLSVAIYLTGLVYGVKAVRAEVPEGKPFGYGQALGHALLISLVAIAAGLAFQYLYETVINPGYVQATLAAQRAKMEAKGMSDTQVDNAMAMMKKFSTPLAHAIFGFIFLAVFDVISCLIAAAFLTRKDPDAAVSL